MSNNTASYTYKLRDASQLLHYLPSSENEFGVQCCMIREGPMSVEEAVKSITSPTTSASKREYRALVTPSASPAPHQEFAAHASLVKTLFDDRNKRRDVAYLRVCPPGKSFETYEKEKYKLAMTIRAYLDLLRFFKSEYHLVSKRMEQDRKHMMDKTEWLPLLPTVSFKGGADIDYRLPLDRANTFDLELVIKKKFDATHKTIMLQYTDEKMGYIMLPGPVMEILCKDLPFITSFLDGEYKEASTSKRSRQS
jgi:hypothetical protein